MKTLVLVLITLPPGAGVYFFIQVVKNICIPVVLAGIYFGKIAEKIAQAVQGMVAGITDKNSGLPAKFTAAVNR